MTTFQDARAFLLKHRTDYDAAVKRISAGRIRFRSTGRWTGSMPNWRATPTAGIVPRSGSSMPAATSETKLSFAALSRRSNQVANFLRAQGLKRGDHLLLLLGNVVPLWETMLAAMKLGVVVIPATTLLTPDELRDRLDRGRAKMVVATQDQVAKFAGLGGDDLVRIVVGASSKHEGWLAFEQAAELPEAFAPDGPTNADDPMLLYFTSGTTAKPKLVRHSQRSYPVGALSTMFWLGLQPGDVHLNISSPGWAKHAWSCLFAPWNAGATVFVVNQPRFDAKGLSRDHRPLRRHDAVRAADGVAAVHPGEACDFKVSLARSLRRRRAAQSRSDRPGPRRMGPDHPRRLRPDRNHRAGRQFAGPEGKSRIDGPPAAGLSRADHR